MTADLASPVLRGPARPDFRRRETLADVLEATVQHHGDRPALRHGAATLTYRELDRQAERAAHHLIGHGAAPGTCIGLWLPRGCLPLVMQAAIAKSGAAWMPFDAEAPPERVAACLAEAGALGLITDGPRAAAVAAAAAAAGLAIWQPTQLEAEPVGPPLRRSGLAGHHPAYIISTSGSTGRPKGIVIPHAAICHLLRAENAVLGVTAEDVVYQGFSVAFDMSFEEIWISWLVGAALWIAPREIAGDPGALPAFLAAGGVTVLHTVPTLLALLTPPLPGIRLVNLGGEACPQALAGRWARPGLRLFNSYGPTETTVTATIAELTPGTPVSIGRPLPNYGVVVVDATLQAVERGTVGELCISGPGVASGYLHRAELTAERFVPNPFASGADDAVLYRSGDLAQVDADGVLHCLGRVDDQVKIRGYRVELGEIEAALAAEPGVATAAVALCPVDGLDRLVAWLVAPGMAVDEALRTRLRGRLPAYMVPDCIGLVAELPRLASGKVDRRALAALPLPLAPAQDGDRAEDAVEAALFAAVAALLPGQPLRRDDDFFADLGGHSLIAARLVSILRCEPRFAHLAVQDVYRGPRLAAIAAVMRRSPASAAVRALPGAHANNRPLRRLACGAAQVAALPVLIGLHVALWLAPFFTYHHLTGDDGDSIPLAVAVSLAVFLAMHVAAALVAVAGVRVLSLGLGAGRYPLWGVSYYRWWLCERLQDIAPIHLLHNSPLYRGWLRALGARIGREAQIGSLDCVAPWLLTIGDHASVGSEVAIANAQVVGGELLLDQVAIGAEASIGSCAVVGGGCVVGRGGRLAGLSALTAGGRLPAGASWAGIPAQASDSPPPPAVAAPATPSRLRTAGEGLLYGLGALVVAMLFFLPLFPTFMLIDWLDGRLLDPALDEHGHLLVGLQYAVMAAPGCLVLVACTVLLAAGIRRVVLPSLAPGRMPVHSWSRLRLWLAGQIHAASLVVLHGLHATVFSPWWYRLLGARVGRDAEISTAQGAVPHLLTIADGAFIADGVMLGDESVEGGWVSVRATSVGARSFVGNGSYVPDGTVIPDDVLVGVMTHAPASAAMRGGDTWLGSPALRLPAREQLSGFPETLTFRPSPWRRLARGAIEALRIVLPIAASIGYGYAIVLEILPQAEDGEWTVVVIRLLLAGLLYGLLSLAGVALIKWLVIGRYRPGAHAMWTPFVWASEAVTCLYEAIAVPNCLDLLRGTPLLPGALRLFGVQVGSGAWIDTTDFTEFDCVAIGDGAELNDDCGPQTHLFEDRIMKIGRVVIGAGACVHTRATVLYDGVVGERCEVGPLTLVMKGERLPPGTRWCGSPAAPWAG